MNNSFKEIYQRIKLAKNVLLLSHQNPDGDAIGSMMALAEIIRKMNKQVDILSTHIPKEFSNIKNIDKIKENSEKNYDLIIIVDTANEHQLGIFANYYQEKAKLIIIDHHEVIIEEEIMHYVDPKASSASILVYRFAKENSLEIDYEIASNIYIGLITDTNNFVYQNTNSEALNVASELIEMGLNTYDMYYTYAQPEYSMNYLNLTKTVIENMEIINDKIVFSYLSYESLLKYPYDTPKFLVNLGRHIKNIEVSILMVEEEPGKYRVNLRSRTNADVAKIAANFGGGGHKRASGFRFVGNIDLVKKELLTEVNEELKEIDAKAREQKND